MAKTVTEMVERGYVERRPDPTDSRVKRLLLAPRGRAALAAARRFHATFERQLEGDVGPTAARQLRRVLQAIVERGPADEGARARLRPT
jgi:DNA-binding MarR family transcriptional regulator